jgi:hypothetical protein
LSRMRILSFIVFFSIPAESVFSIPAFPIATE